jgi:pimeloyl-ACP methyl ester carboxylesterase
MALYDAALTRWPVPHSTLSLPTRHGSTFVVASGAESAPPLLLLHGAGTNSAMWAGDVSDYSRHYRVLAVDLLGEAGRSAHNRPSWNGPAYAEWLDDVLTALGVEAASVVGLSQGGWTALKFAVWKPQRVKALVLLSPGGITRDKLSFVVRALPLMPLGRRGMKCINRLRWADRLFLPRSKRRSPRRRPLQDAPRRAADLHRRRVATTDDAGVPLMVRATFSRCWKITARMRKLVPNLTATILPEAGPPVGARLSSAISAIVDPSRS